MFPKGLSLRLAITMPFGYTPENAAVYRTKASSVQYLSCSCRKDGLAPKALRLLPVAAFLGCCSTFARAMFLLSRSTQLIGNGLSTFWAQLGAWLFPCSTRTFWGAKSLRCVGTLELLSASCADYEPSLAAQGTTAFCRAGLVVL